MAFIFQDSRQLAKLGKKCPWSVAWVDPVTNKQRSKVIGGKTEARHEAAKIDGEIRRGTYSSPRRMDWAAFVAKYDETVLSSSRPRSRQCALESLATFHRITRISRVDKVTTVMIAEFRAARSKESGVKKGSVISPASVNKELRHIRAALKVAHDWEYLAKMPAIKMMDEMETERTAVSQDDFGKIYESCDVAKFPKGEKFAASDWWRALLTFAFMTGWRISEILALKWEDVDLDACEAKTHAKDNKGGRDSRVGLHPVVVDHLRTIRSFSPNVFPWDYSEQTLYRQFRRIQTAGGIDLPCDGDHEHTDACHTYGFHDLRRGFATEHALLVPAKVLQHLMRHKSFSTTELYIQRAEDANRYTEQLKTPTVFSAKKSG